MSDRDTVLAFQHSDWTSVPTERVTEGIARQMVWGERVMVCRLVIAPRTVTPVHSHPHEQGGILIRGKVQLTIGDETRLCEAGSMFIIPSNVKHRAVAIDGPAVVLDCFSPVREDYAEMLNKYIPPVGRK